MIIFRDRDSAFVKVGNLDVKLIINWPQADQRARLEPKKVVRKEKEGVRSKTLVEGGTRPGREDSALVAEAHQRFAPPHTGFYQLSRSPDCLIIAETILQ